MSTQFGHPSHPAASPLGKPVAYAQHYAPELLFPIARQGKRDEIGIAADALPFVGEDLWNAYELSWLDPRGKPVVALAQFVVPAWSPNIIESKSFKLYLNSFNQTKLSDVAVLTETLVRDLSAAAGAPGCQTLTAAPGSAACRPCSQGSALVSVQQKAIFMGKTSPSCRPLTLRST